MLVINTSKCTQLIKTPADVTPMEVHHGMVFDDEGLDLGGRTVFKEFDINLLYKTKVLSIIRKYALGDLIQLIPILRKVKEKYGIEKVHLLTSDRFLSPIGYSFDDIKVMGYQICANPGGYDLGITVNLDGLLERDHSIHNKQNSLHRVDIYAKYFNVDSTNLNWDIKPRGIILKPYELNKERKNIALQIRGSGKMKTIPYDYIQKLTGKLSETHNVILLDHDCNKGFEGKNITNLCGKLQIPEVIELLKECDCLISMDSGLLWLAHVSNTPVVTLLGPTREHERLSLHPQYPKKAKCVNLSKMINCEPCFETKVNCNGTINCMNSVSYDMIEKEVVKQLKLILGE